VGDPWTRTEWGPSVSVPVEYYEGESTLITYYATDYAGNRETEQTFTVGQDQNAPDVWDTSPAYDATGVSRASNITADFSEEMDRTTLTESIVQLYQKHWYQAKKKKGKKVRRVWTYKWIPVSAQVSYDADTKTVTLDPSSDLAANTNYLAMVITGAKDKAGNALADNYSWTFTTGSG
jgi:hypothetical protein